MHVDDDAHVTGIPHVYTTLFLIIILSAIATWIAPAGQYNRIFNDVEGFVIIPGTYHQADPHPTGPMQTLSTVYRGMVQAAETVFFVFIAFASIHVVVSTGAFHALIAHLLRYFEGRGRILVIPLFITIIGMASSTIAVFEEMFAFIPIFVAVAIAMRYDALVGMSIVALGIGLGYSGSFLNPFTVGIAQDIAGLPPFSGAFYRIFCHFVMIAVASVYVMVYASRISHHPEKSLVYGLKNKNARIHVHLDKKFYEEHPIQPKHNVVLMIMLIGIATIIWGVCTRSWFFEQIVTIYLFMGITSGLVMGWSPDKIAHRWAEGASEITSTCLKIALAKGVILILDDGRVLDTMIYWMAEPLLSLPKWAAAEAMLIVQTLINFFVPSGSGQAVVSMPIMVPLADVLGISRQTAVLAFQFGDGVSNILWLTGSMPIICKFAKVPPRKWLRWFLPLFGLIFATQMLCIAGALAIGY